MCACNVACAGLPRRNGFGEICLRTYHASGLGDSFISRGIKSLRPADPRAPNCMHVPGVDPISTWLKSVTKHSLLRASCTRTHSGTPPARRLWTHWTPFCSIGALHDMPRVRLFELVGCVRDPWALSSRHAACRKSRSRRKAIPRVPRCV